jgi:hypothetical protein
MFWINIKLLSLNILHFIKTKIHFLKNTPVFRLTHISFMYRYIEFFIMTCTTQYEMLLFSLNISLIFH